MSLDDVVADAVAGDEQAFTALFRSLQPPLLRYLRVLTPSTAEDAASETWAAVVPRLPAFEGGERELRSWLFTIARSKVIDRARHDARRPVLLSGEDDSLLDRPSSHDVAQHRGLRRLAVLLEQTAGGQADVGGSDSPPRARRPPTPQL